MMRGSTFAWAGLLLALVVALVWWWLERQSKERARRSAVRRLQRYAEEDATRNQADRQRAFEANLNRTLTAPGGR
jgi:hypothetical protein